MSVEVELRTALGDLVGYRVAPIIFPQPPVEPTWPAIRTSIVSSTPIVDICGDGDDETSDLRIQLDVVAATFDAARALRLQVMTRMRSFSPPAILEFSTGEFDEETRTFREILQYSINGSSPSESP